MLLSAERHYRILNHIRHNRSATVDDLSELLHVSGNTVRRDLSALEAKGLIQRMKGGAVIANFEQMMQPLRLREGINERQKYQIGKTAVRLIKPNTSIILDAGSTTLQMARRLRGTVGLTVVTNSFDVCHALVANGDVSVICSGGVLIESIHSFVGAPAERFFETIHAEQLFLAAKGVSFEHGLTNANLYENPVKQRMIGAAEEIILLADSSKFGKVSLTRFASVEKVGRIITDAGIDDASLEAARRLGIEVIIAADPQD
jgi:DeoR/GlpR family transcriptional regulator of sugar metabolism